MSDERKPTRDEAIAAAAGNYANWLAAWKMKPEGITDQEWAVYQNNDPLTIPPAIRDKVEAALGWKKDDVDDAREIAEKVLGAVKIAEKGHVPEERRTMASLRDVILSHQPTKERRSQLFCRCGTWFSAQHQLDALRAAGFEGGQ